MRYYDTVEKFNAFVAKEPELRKRYLAALETLQVNLPPADEEYLPYRKPDDLFRTAKRLRDDAVALADAGLDPYEVADSTEKHAIREKAKIGARRELRAIDEEQADDIIDLLNSFVADGIDMMHHLKRLSKIENNPNGYYTQQYRRLSTRTARPCTTCMAERQGDAAGEKRRRSSTDDDSHSIVTLPFAVARSSLHPPPLMVPVMLSFDVEPLMVIGRSVLIEPKLVRAWTL